MKKFKMSYLVGALLCSAVLAQPAEAATFSTAIGATTADGLVDAEAIFTLSTNTVEIILINLEANPTAAGQLISALTFNVTGATGTGSLTTSNSGNLGTIISGGAYSLIGADPLARWTATEGAGTTIDLTTLGGGTPNRLIIGPDNLGGFTGTGLFSNVNSSITGNHNPSILGSATFDITVAGVTSSSVISNVVFQFGTTAGSNLVTGNPGGPGTGGNPHPVSEPENLLLITLGLIGFGLQRRKASTKNNRD